MTVAEANLTRLDARVTRLEQIVAHLSNARLSAVSEEVEPQPGGERAQLQAMLQATGLVAEPGPHVRARAEAWQRLSKAERQRFRQEMDALRLDPPLSQIIMDNRR